MIKSNTEEFYARRSIEVSFSYLIITEGNVLMSTLNIHQQQTRRQVDQKWKKIVRVNFIHTKTAEEVFSVVCRRFAGSCFWKVGKRKHKKIVNCCQATNLTTNGFLTLSTKQFCVCWDSLKTSKKQTFLTLFTRSKTHNTEKKEKRDNWKTESYAK